MAVRRKAFHYINEMLELAEARVAGKRVCVISHLNFQRDTRAYCRSVGMKGWSLVSSYFKYLGADAIELDIHKAVGVIIDLGSAITDESLLGSFDILIDGATAEHIDNQYEYWRNCFNLLKVGGIAIHTLPFEGNWRKHSTWVYSLRWLKDFVTTSQYQLLDARVSSDQYGKIADGRQLLFWAMKKTEDTQFKYFHRPIFCDEGYRKDRNMYDRFVLPIRGKLNGKS